MIMMTMNQNWDSSNDTASSGQVTIRLSLMIQANLDATIRAQDDTREILLEWS
jgi:hypothetical protein